jgi:AhpD family alkylhydroperoxidase
MKNPVMIVEGVLPPLMELGKALAEVGPKAGLPQKTSILVHLRASQINGCSFCVNMHANEAVKAGETNDRLYAVAAWREAPQFSAAERAALALTEAVTRLDDRAEPVPDDVWAEAQRHYDEPALAALILNIANTNLWNRINATTKQVAGSWPS